MQTIQHIFGNNWVAFYIYSAFYVLGMKLIKRSKIYISDYRKFNKCVSVLWFMWHVIYYEMKAFSSHDTMYRGNTKPLSWYNECQRIQKYNVHTEWILIKIF